MIIFDSKANFFQWRVESAFSHPMESQCQTNKPLGSSSVMKFFFLVEYELSTNFKCFSDFVGDLPNSLFELID